MPRDGSGNYTLPAGNPVVTGTTIDVAWANPTMSDVALQLNNVLTKDGVVGPSGPFLLADGAVGAPGLAFSGETTMGLYRIGTGILGLSVGGVERGRLTSSQLTLAVNAAVGDGTATRTVSVNGLNSGTAGGGSVVVQNNSVSLIGIGNYSNLIGGAYDATPTLYTQGGLKVTDGSTPRLTLNASGTLLWGTLGATAPAIEYTLASTNAVRLAHVGTTGTDAYIGVASSVGGSLITGSPAYSMEFRNDQGFSFGNASTQWARIDTSGNVGIGGAADSAVALDVHRTVSASSSANIRLIDDGTARNIQVLQLGGSYSYAGATGPGGWIYTASQKLILGPDGAYGIDFVANGAKRAELTTSGYFGVNTTSPDAFLGVNGAGTTDPLLRLHFNRSSFANVYAGFAHAGDGGGLIIGNINDSADRSINFANGTTWTGRSTRLSISNDGVLQSLIAGNNANGGNILLGITTNSTNKYSSLVSTQYSATSEPEGFALVTGQGVSGGNYVAIGGGLGEQNAATQIYFYTAGNETTRTGTLRAQIDSSGVFTYGSNEIGFRNIPIGSDVDGATVGVSNRGCMAYMDTGGGCTIPASTFAAGDTLSLLNNTGSSQTITQASGLTMYLAGTTTTGNRTLADKGIATIWFQTATVCYISGPGVS